MSDYTEKTYPAVSNERHDPDHLSRSTMIPTWCCKRRLAAGFLFVIKNCGGKKTLTLALSA